MAAQSPDGVNRATFDDVTALPEFESSGRPQLDAWSDPGESAAFRAFAGRVRGGRVLDLGVGAGRTTTFLRLLTDNYTAVDYTPGMVAACRARHPGVDVRVGDARDLSEFACASVDLVVFSFNGIDSVGHEDRGRVLAEASRVLRPGGLFHYSTLNLDGPCFRATPFRPAGSQLEPTWSPKYRAAMRAVWLMRAPLAVPRALRARRRALRHSVTGDGWAMAPMEAYDFGLVVHYTTLASVRDELTNAGMGLEVAFDAEFGRPLDVDGTTARTRYFQLIAHRL